ncbi:MAG: hypothetical protein GX846_09195 [Deltaproteobacteria bacterium]|nr:hypothetical protein [Deltaproteobacteria bacterium]
MVSSVRMVSVFIISFLLAGCITIPKKTEKEIVQQYYALPALSNEVLDQKIEAIGDILNNTNLPQDQKKTAASIFQAYVKIQELNKENAAKEDNIKTIQIFFNTLNMIEQRYFSSETGEMEKRIINDYSSFKKEIYDDYLADNFQAVISKSRELESLYGEKGLTPDIGMILVDSLSKSSMTKKALSNAKEIYNEIISRPDMTNLLSDIINLEIKAGNTRGAAIFFEKLVDLMDEKNSTYKNIENKISKARQEHSALDISIEENIPEINPEKVNNAEQKIANVNKLLLENDFSGARLILFRWRLSADEGPEIDMIEKALKGVDSAEEKFSNPSRRDHNVLEEAKRKIEDEKYEEAITILGQVVFEDLKPETEKLKNLAIDKHIYNERLKAAKLFVAASEEKNTQKKRELLLSSRVILERLINRYPETPLLEKLERYVMKVNLELDRINF